MLKHTKSSSVASFRSILEAGHLRGYSFTQYSTIHDLNNISIYYFKDSDFKHAVTIDLKAELKKGEKWYNTEEFFKKKKVTEISCEQIHPYNGELIDHYEDGRIKSQLGFKNGKIDGSCVGYYLNGKKAWCSSYKQGEFLGVLEYWRDSGKPLLTYELNDKTQTNIIDFYPSGKKLLKLALTNRENDIIELKNIIVWNENGDLSYKGRYTNGLFFLNKSDTVYTGKLLTYYTNSQPHVLRRFKKGKTHGKRITWDRNGKIEKVEFYQEGRIQKTIRYSKDKH